MFTLKDEASHQQQHSTSTNVLALTKDYDSSLLSVGKKGEVSTTSSLTTSTLYFQNFNEDSKDSIDTIDDDNDTDYICRRTSSNKPPSKKRTRQRKPRTANLSLNKDEVEMMKSSSAINISNVTMSNDDAEDENKKYSCEICSQRYKTRAGLVYHMGHVHADGKSDVNTSPQPIPASFPLESTVDTISRNDSVKSASDIAFCDFCLGNASENKKTRLPEGLVSCGECGRSGHFSCLHFTQNMVSSVSKYSWQCIECKSCGVCGTSENDDQLLFCDDCDRGYHMYCLKPPLISPPDGSWSCQLCIQEFGDNASINQKHSKSS